MYVNKTVKLGNCQLVLTHDTNTNTIVIQSGNVGSINCSVDGDINGSVLGNVSNSVFGNIGGEVTGNIKGPVKGSIYGYVKGRITKYVGGYIGGNVLGVGGDVLEDVKGSVLGQVCGTVGSNNKEEVENETGDDMKNGNIFFETVIGGITDGVDDNTKDKTDELETAIETVTETENNMEDSEMKMNELQYMYKRMQQVRSGKREGYTNELDKALKAFEAILLAESQLYEAIEEE